MPVPTLQSGHGHIFGDRVLTPEGTGTVVGITYRFVFVEVDGTGGFRGTYNPSEVRPAVAARAA